MPSAAAVRPKAASASAADAARSGSPRERCVARLEQRLHVVLVEVAHADRAHAPLAVQRLHLRPALFKHAGHRPVDQVKIYIVWCRASRGSLQRPRARAPCACRRSRASSSGRRPAACTPESRMPCPTPRSLPYTAAVSMWRYPASNAQRTHSAHRSFPATL